MLANGLPSFLEVEKAITGDPAYSMFNLSLREEWNQKNFESKKVKCTKNYFVNRQENENAAATELNELNNNEPLP